MRPRRRHLRLPALLAASALVLALPPAAAQLSPGPLAAPHAGLEGAAHCLRCHQTGRGVEPARCLTCHVALRRQIAAARGLHTGARYQACQRCHIDHHGADVELIWWGDDGEAAFDHRQTGHPLEGRHATVPCRNCHRADRIRQPSTLRQQGKDLDRTFLGLEPVCSSCHQDVHRGQLEPAACRDCHSQQEWTPAAGFRHDRGHYPLTGEHRRVACARCHATETTVDGAAFVRYRPIAAGSCADCHRDPHSGRLGPRCESCHSTAGWRVGEGTGDGFDHRRTRYPLTGRHRTATCRSCHGSSPASPIVGFERCTTCHADAHWGQLRHRSDAGACEACHSVDGFRPARFSLEDHDDTDYPLLGAHRAIPCVECHPAVPPGDMAIARAERRWETPPVRSPPRAPFDPAAPTPRLSFAATRCRDCHLDPHRGSLDRYQGADGCTACHQTESWREVSFDHALSRFPLSGRHVDRPCRSCHPAERDLDGVPRAALSARPLDCGGCHEDPHRGQLTSAGSPSSCQRCHSEGGWTPVHFDHDRDSRFALAGAHRRVACAGCHVQERVDGRAAVRYRPIASACRDCHRAGGRDE